MASVCKKLELGSIAGVPEIKVEWEGHPIPHPVIFKRDSKVTLYAEFCGPDDIINKSWNDVRDCAVGVIGTAVLASVISDLASAFPAFKAAFIACLEGEIGSEAKQLGVALSTKQESGPWRKV